MKLVERKDIDVNKWNTKVANALDENIFSFTWYLDAVVENWYGLMDGDYETILPIPYTKKINVKQFIQAPFTREYQIIGNGFNWHDAIQFIQNKFSSVHFRCGIEIPELDATMRSHQLLDLKATKKYSENAKRMIKKANAFEFKKSKDVSIIINLFKENIAHKIDTISKKDVVRLAQLMNNAIDLNKGELFCLIENNQCIAAAFFFKGKNTITYLKGASTDEAKKQGAMYRLIDEAISAYKDYSTFDFGGSDIKSVAEFYHKFGARDRAYYEYKIDNLPRWFKLLKKLKS